MSKKERKKEDKGSDERESRRSVVSLDPRSWTLHCVRSWDTLLGGDRVVVCLLTSPMYPPGASAAMVLFLVGVVTFFFLVFLPFVLASLLRSVAARALLAPLSVVFLFFFFFSFFLIFLSSIRPLESAGKHLEGKKEILKSLSKKN